MGEVAQVEYKSVNLMSQTSFFVEVENIVFYSDAQIIERLVEIIKESDKFHRFFPTVLEEFGDLDFRSIVEKIGSKNVSNILYQYANWGVIQNSVSDQDVIGYCDRIHDYLLYDCDSIPATFEPTSIGNSIRVVSKDTNLTKLTLYLKKSSPSIWRELAKHFRIGSCNIDCVSGPLYEAMEEADADFYFLSEFQSIEGLCKESTKHRDIITLANPYNLNFYSDQIKENTPDAEIAFYSKYNIDVSFAKTPI